MTTDLADLIFYAMVGRSPSSRSGVDEIGPVVEPTDLTERVSMLLAADGIDAEELVLTGISGSSWPRFIPASERGEVGAAQFRAALDEVVEHLHRRYEPKPVRRTDQQLSPGDLRLMEDRPPHHGSVG